MKKIIFGMMILSVMLTGCGKDTLSCTSKSNDLGKNMVTKIIVTFDKDEASNLVTDISTTYDQEYLAELDANYKNFEENFESYEDYEGVKTKLSKKENVLNINLEFDMTKEDAKNNSGFAKYTDKKDYKQRLEKSGYTCN